MMRVVGFAMIVIGGLGLGTALVDWRTIGLLETEDETSITAADPGSAGPVEAADGEMTANSERLAGADGETVAAEATGPSDPANVQVFERGGAAGASGPALLADITAAREVVSEDSGHANFLVTLSEPADRSVVIIFSTLDVSANDPEDYRSQRGTVTFQPGVVSAEIRTPLVDDDVKEEDEQFAIVLNGAPGIVNFKNRRVIATIRDDD